MAKKFSGFTTDQQHMLLKEMGYDGPAQKDEMEAFLAASPSAAAKIGRYTDIARQRVEGEPLAKTGMAEGGSTGNDDEVGINPPDDTDIPAGTQLISEGTETPEVTVGAESLDTAQQSYSDAMGQLTEAQKALSGVESSGTLDEATGRYSPTAEDLESELGDTYGTGTTAIDGNDPFAVGDFKEFIARTEWPEDLDDYETVKSGRNFKIKYSDGTEIDLGRVTEASVRSYAEVYKKAVEKVKASQTYGDVTSYNQLLQNVEDADLLVTQTQADTATAQKQFETTDIPSTSEALGKAITSPSSVLQQPDVYGLKVEGNQIIDSETGQVTTMESLTLKQAQAAGEVDDPAIKATLAYLDGLSDEEKASKYPIPPAPPVERNWLFGETAESKAARAEWEKEVAGVQARMQQDALKARTETYDAVMSQPEVEAALADLAAATGTPSEEALMKAETMNPEELAQLGLDPAQLDIIRQIPEIKRQLEVGEQPTAALFDQYTKSEAAEFEGEVGEIDAATFTEPTPEAEAEVDYNLPPTEVAEVEKSKIEDAANFDEYATADEKKSEFVPDVEAEETAVGDDEIVDVNEIINNDEVIATAKTLEALNEAATAKAATATFTQQLEAKAIVGDVSAASTVQFQLGKIMESFNDGTPAWAAGALRKANAVMAARGLGSSSMAGAAIVQATLESAIPIAQADAATFAAMDMENVRNAQAVALANAAAAQNFELANLNNEQAVRIQNSMNNANLQLKNLSNEQEVVLANAQFKAALQGQELGISANIAISNAARYAAVNDINLTNRQQTAILRSSQNLEVEMANLSNAQQTALSNLQVKAAMMGQELTNEQQMAVLESTQAFEANMQDATSKQQAFIQDAVARAAMEGRVLDNKQQTALFNVSNVVAERGIELDNEQQTRVFNMSNKLTVDMAELSNRQQTALANAQIEAAMKGQELSNKQQVNVIKAERIAEIANMNFTAEQSRALQNAQLAQTVDLANLNNKQAKMLADAAAMSQVDMANLNNRQQAAAQQAQAFLQMDMANLDNEQQAVMFEAQSLVQSILSDQAAENAGMQFNAESINQVTQFYDGISSQIEQFNVAQSNAMEQFNAGEANSMEKFEAELANQRDIFNAQNELVIAQANTAWRQAVATANTAALNEANMQEVMAANNLTMQGLAELWQQERDLMNYAWSSAENQLGRDHELVKAKIQSDSAESSAFSSAAGGFLSSLVGAYFKYGL